MANRTKLPTFLSGVISVSVLLAFLMITADHPRSFPSPQVPTPSVTPFIRGYIATTVGGDRELATAHFVTPVHDVYLPGVRVWLVNPGNGSKTEPAITDLSGRFTVRAPEGRYQICWAARGFVEECSKSIFSVSNSPLHVGTIRIPVDRRAGTTVVFGKVSMADNSLPRALEPLANINAFALVELLDRQHNGLGKVYVNNFGEYLLPQVPAKEEITLRARIEGGSTDQLIRPEANLAGAAFHPINLQIANHPPRLDPLVASDATGHRVAAALPGDTVHLESRASDPDGDPLKFTWLVSDGSGDLNSTTAPSVAWKLPNHEGLYSVTLIAYDGKGGYAESYLALRADKHGIPFSGTVNSSAGGFVGGAQVEINGVTTATDAMGFFRVHIKDARQFVLNIRKLGYGLVSQVYDRGITGGQWILTPATVAALDPTKQISLTNERRPTDCPGMASARLDWKDFPQSAKPQWQDGKGRVVAPFAKLELPLPGRDQRPYTPVSYQESKGCGPGISVKIPPNSLQDETGKAPTGKVQVSLSTVDLMSPYQMPGDYTVKLPSGNTRVMQSYGAGGIEITAGAKKFNLKPGAHAQVTIPVDPAQLKAGGPLPPAIPLLFYDEKNGVWLPEGTAHLQGHAYVATVKHFSEINTDTIKVNQSCVDVLSPAMPASYELEVTIPLGPGQAPKVPPPYHIDNSPPSEHALYNLPSHTNIVLTPYDNNTKIPYGTFVVNTGGPQNPTSPNRPAGPPFYNPGACSTQVILTPQTLPDTPTGGAFLHGLFSFAAVNTNELDAAFPNDVNLRNGVDQATANYYTNIDPRGKRLTLDGFRNTNGMSLDPANPNPQETRGVYANTGDLGFGRDMHCKKQTASDAQDDVACYVTNYGDITTPDIDDANAAITGTTVGQSSLVASVAMEYSRIENAVDPEFDGTNTDRVVKFYVYSGDGTHLLRAADLDKKGARPIPQLCMVCHGGNYPGGANVNVPGFNNRNDVKLGSLFLPFDLHNYTFPTTPTAQIPDPSKHGQQVAFQTLNQDIVNAANPGLNGQAIHDVISCANVGDCMYPGGGPQDQHEDFVVPAASASWQLTAANQTMYKAVVANACRTCHVANAATNLRFTDSSQLVDVQPDPPGPARLGPVQTRVCVQHVMPHSKRTHDLFWNSLNPHQPGELEVFGDALATPKNGWINPQTNPNVACGAFTPGGQTPASPFDPVQAIFTNRCAQCHTGNAPPAGLNLALNPYNNIVNVNSSEVAAVKRIAPNDTTHSYLLLKLLNQQNTVGGFGSQMPADGTAPLSNADITTIQNWINAGAPQ